MADRQELREKVRAAMIGDPADSATRQLDGMADAAIRIVGETCAKAATSFLVGDPKAGVPLRKPLSHEIADHIRALTQEPT